MSGEVTAQQFSEMGRVLGELTQLKNAAYGDSFARSGEVMMILYPNGISPEQYRDALGVIRVIDKLFRLASRKTAFGESPWKDIAGYGIVGAVTDENDQETGGTIKYEAPILPADLKHIPHSASAEAP